MKESTEREKVFKSIRNSLLTKAEPKYRDVDLKSNVFQEFKEDASVEFAEQFAKVGGKFIYCADDREMLSFLKILFTEEKWEKGIINDSVIEQICNDAGVANEFLTQDHKEVKVVVTLCDFLVARFGSIMVSSGLKNGRRIFAIPDIHVVIARANQLVPELSDALDNMKQKYNDNWPSMVINIAGPSRVVDIGNMMVQGAQGPKELYLLYIDN